MRDLKKTRTLLWFLFYLYKFIYQRRLTKNQNIQYLWLMNTDSNTSRLYDKKMLKNTFWPDFITMTRYSDSSRNIFDVLCK
jgi:hypothetical protein